MKSFGILLSQLRSARGLTQRQLAQIIGMDPTTLSKMENDRARPRTATILGIAAALEADAKPLLEASGRQSGPPVHELREALDVGMGSYLEEDTPPEMRSPHELTLFLEDRNIPSHLRVECDDAVKLIIMRMRRIADEASK